MFNVYIHDIHIYIYSIYVSPCNGYKIIFKDLGHYFSILNKISLKLKMFLYSNYYNNTVYNN